jgi:hypothetical protein
MPVILPERDYGRWLEVDSALNVSLPNLPLPIGKGRFVLW